MLRLWFAPLFVVCALLLLPRVARADAGLPITVLSLDSEDSEEQADALTGAIRSRIRKSQGWDLVGTSPSLGTLTAALRCPSRPTEECQVKIAEQIKADRYIWGHVSKAGNGQVAVDVHLFQKGKPDVVAKETYAENLKEANDDALMKIAQRIVTALGGTAVGSIVVHAGKLDGKVVVDGQTTVPLKAGAAKIDVAPGPHAVEISSPGFVTKRSTVKVEAGAQAAVDVEPEAVPEDTKPFPTRKVIGGAAAAVGVALGILAVERYSRFVALQDETDKVKVFYPGDPNCGAANEHPQAGEACRFDKNARGVSAVMFTAGITGAVLIGAGVYFLLTDPSGPQDKPKTAKRPQILPAFGPNSGSVLVTGSF